MRAFFDFSDILSESMLFILRRWGVLTAFTAGLLLITISELGDKSFFIAVILSMRYLHHLVLAGVVGALAIMTVLSVAIGQIFSFLPKIVLHYSAIVLFLLFGIRLLYEASRMTTKTECEAFAEAHTAIEQGLLSRRVGRTAMAVLLESVALTFFAEWGDRTQISTIALAAANNPIGVTLGAILGHTLCTVVAVMGGCMIAGKISERMITAIGGVLFLIFAAITFGEGV
jgi:putative Ca2+/H+ antiporter (TMEM165/GDT1 family)